MAVVPDMEHADLQFALTVSMLCQTTSKCKDFCKIQELVNFSRQLQSEGVSCTCSSPRIWCTAALWRLHLTRASHLAETPS